MTILSRPSRPTRPRHSLLLTVVASAAALSLAGCGSSSQPPAGSSTSGPATSATSTSPPAGSTPATSTPATPAPATSPGAPSPTAVTASTYFFTKAFMGERLAAAHRQVTPPTVATSALQQLLAGPSASERSAGLYSEIPAGTQLLGVSISNGTATVDLSAKFNSAIAGAPLTTARVAQVVFTVTQFLTVQRAQLEVEGHAVTGFGGVGFEHPLTRADFEDWLPQILVESPTIGDTIHSPVRVYGSANTFEAVMQLEITDWDGKIVASETVHATSGTGTRGTFDVTIPYRTDRSGAGEIIAFYYSAKDGSRAVVAEIPLTVAP